MSLVMASGQPEVEHHAAEVLVRAAAPAPGARGRPPCTRHVAVADELHHRAAAACRHPRRSAGSFTRRSMKPLRCRRSAVSSGRPRPICFLRSTRAHSHAAAARSADRRRRTMMCDREWRVAESCFKRSSAVQPSMIRQAECRARIGGRLVFARQRRAPCHRATPRCL